ncbi:putative pectinesterase [Helianthus annuus]|uniref:pectinesterase n=1 Tax=Helianthus annuus TaxID=4232 RepID=A0A251USR6_HELAN|nr:pectinesterase 1 [Helianthus annuus]KAF5807193.1 putative pectinesterase [Helianthus annuus]KAJ0585709.1 putative pectinesterase [Helianthus annuus]KAJ0920325.1 putative pectinesterase [Helianthus annuus]KAJ0923955.1 putative pectinesterase [Helianthus annuus]
MEESVNFVKGYGKIDPSDDDTTAVHRQSPSPNRRKTLTIAVTVTLLLFAIIIAVTIAAATTAHHQHTKQSQPSQSPSLKSSESIKTVCAVTQHPDTCFTDVVSVNSGNKAVDPVVIFNLTLQLAVTELTNVSSLPKTLISNSNDLRTGSALRDCANLFDDAVSQLSRSVESMRGESVLTVEKVGDLKTWISAAMTDQETCVDGLEEMGSTAVDEVKMKVQRSSVCMSNSLAILGHMDEILEKFGMHLH